MTTSAIAQVQNLKTKKIFNVEGILENGRAFVCQVQSKKKSAKRTEDGSFVRDENGNIVMVTTVVTKLRTFTGMDVVRIA